MEFRAKGLGISFSVFMDLGLRPQSLGFNAAGLMDSEFWGLAVPRQPK